MKADLKTLRSLAFEYIDSHREEMLALLTKLVTMESYSDDIEAVNALVGVLAKEMEEDLKVRTIDYENAGSTLVAVREGEKALAPVVLIGHCDTVHPTGSLERDMPLRFDSEGMGYGPGILDMKGGIVVALYALRALTNAGYTKRGIKLIVSGDEETGHGNSGSDALIREECRGAGAAFVCETGYADNRIIVRRKGTGRFTIESFGISAHAGICPEKGCHAILDMARRVEHIQSLNNNDRGITYNVGVISGGTVPNAVPDYCRVDIDIRYTEPSQVSDILEALEEAANTCYVDGVRSKLSGEMQFLPMEETEGNLALFTIVRDAAEELGYVKPYAASTGGGSDAANSSAVGVPSVCAMGIQGGMPHTKDEFVIVESLYERAKLLIASILLAEERGFL